MSTENPTARSVAKHWIITFSIGSLFLTFAFAQGLPTPTSLTWDQVKAKFQSANPTLKADAISVDEMKAQEITAFLRPNPQFTLSSDGTQLTPHNGAWQPIKGSQLVTNFSYLHERQHKRELRQESAKEGTQIAS